VNGVITKRLTFTNIPLQNYDDIYVCGNGGFNGKLSSLRYWSYALNVFEINKVVSQGPNLSYNPGNNFVQNYLSTNWYTSA
jgi:predicted nucleotide-binding protein (sugar kinase/HSP70/actin superfamily)